MQIHFTAYARPEPQGSMKGFVLPGKGSAKPRAILTSVNSKMKPYRNEVSRVAIVAVADAGSGMPVAGKHVPVGLCLDFYLARPESIPKKRTRLVVKPDIDKLVRSTSDALSGILYADDAQIVDLNVRKHYGSPERVEVSMVVL
jgi:Holliday junction resolvase RusA-like endonuclease